MLPVKYASKQMFQLGQLGQLGQWDMTRIVKDPVVRRNEILDVAERLLTTKGYEQMAIQDIVDELQIAKGTVYHYFDTKSVCSLRR